MTNPAPATAPTRKPSQRYRLPGIANAGIAQLSLLETALWPLQGGVRSDPTFATKYAFKAGEEKRFAHVSVYAPLGLQPNDEYILWGLLGLSLSRPQSEPTLLATPHWMLRRLGLDVGGSQYDQLRASIERLALVAYQNTAFYNPVVQRHERVTFHFLSSYLPTRGRGGDVDPQRAWRIEWSPMFFQMCQATGGTLLFDLDLYRTLTPAARRLFLKLKDRFWRAKRVYLNVDDLTIHGLGYSASRPLKKRKFDLTACMRELLDAGVIELGKGQTSVQDLFLRRGEGVYVVQFFEGPYFRSPLAHRSPAQLQAIADDPLYPPLKAIGVDDAAIRRIFKHFSRGLIQRWIRITDAAAHESPPGFPGFKTSPAAFLIDGIQNQRLPPDWMHAHEKEQQRRRWELDKASLGAEEGEQRSRYQAERDAGLKAYLDSTEGRTCFQSYYATFLEFYRAVEPHRFEEAAREAALHKIDQEHFLFPDFGVWLLERRVTPA